MEDAEVELSAWLGSSRVTLSELINLKPGDVITTDFNGKATLLAEDVPIFKGQFGASRGMQAVKLETRIKRSKPNPIDYMLSGKTA
jgi:flagellar motor switch protein FliM